MSDHQGEGPAVSGRAVLAGIASAALLGGLAGVLYSAASWPRPNWIAGGTAQFAYMVLAGLVVGGGTGLVVGLVLAWHGAKVGGDPAHPVAAPLWGGFSGLILGLSFGPLCGFVLGIAFNQWVGGALLGLVCGPLLAILSWQIGYWLPRLAARG